MKIKPGFWLNLKLVRTNITRANVTYKNVTRITVPVKDNLYFYHICPITVAPKKYKAQTKSNATNFLKNLLKVVHISKHTYLCYLSYETDPNHIRILFPEK